MLERLIFKPLVAPAFANKQYDQNQDIKNYNEWSEEMIVQNSVTQLFQKLDFANLEMGSDDYFFTERLQKNDIIQIFDSSHRLQWFNLTGRVTMSAEFETYLKGRNWLALFKRPKLLVSIYLAVELKKVLSDPKGVIIDGKLNDIVQENFGLRNILDIDQKMVRGLFDKNTGKNQGYVSVVRLNSSLKQNEAKVLPLTH